VRLKGCLTAAGVAVLAMGGCTGLLMMVPLPEEEVVETPAIDAGPPAPAPEVNHMEEGKKLGFEAATAAQTAATYEQWNSVARKWRAAIAELKEAPLATEQRDQALAKAKEYERNLAVAELRAAELAPPGDLDRFNDWVREIDPPGNVIGKLVQDGSRVEVYVTVNFLAQNKDVQREAAAGLQRQWAAIHSPTDPDKARIWLRTPSGRHFGGSRAMAGSMIYIDE
jgi:hypothetical protein